MRSKIRLGRKTCVGFPTARGRSKQPWLGFLEVFDVACSRVRPMKAFHSEREATDLVTLPATLLAVEYVLQA